MNPARRWNEGSPRGGAPRGESGLILLAERSASALHLCGNLHASWGIQLGDTVSPSVSPSVSPCVSPRCRASDGRIGPPHVVTARRRNAGDALDIRSIKALSLCAIIDRSKCPINVGIESD